MQKVVGLLCATFIICLLCAPFLVIAFLSFPYGLSLYECKAVLTKPSPNKKWKAVVYVGNGGATTGYNSTVNLFCANKNQPTTSDKFIDKGIVFEMHELPNIELKWLATNALKIEYFAPKKWKVFKQLKNYEQIKIITKHTVVDKPIL